MTILQVEHGVRDFERWKRAFDGDPIGREAGGVRRYRILRHADDPDYVLIELEFGSLDQAKAFRGALEELWGKAADELGLKGPRARIFDTDEDREY